MSKKTVRLLAALRWVAVAWVVYCAFNLFKWWRHEEPAMVAGWFLIGSIWGCLLGLITNVPINRNQAGGLLALFAPVCLVVYVFYRAYSIQHRVDSGPNWEWSIWCLLFDLTLCTWGWRFSRWRLILIYFLAVGTGIGAVALALTDPSTTWVVVRSVVVGVVVLAALFMLCQSVGSARPLRLTLKSLILLAIDASILFGLIWDSQNSGNLDLLHLLRLILVAAISWELTPRSRDHTDDLSTSDTSWRNVLPLRSFRVVAWSLLIGWTALGSWLYPRCVASMTEIHSKWHYGLPRDENSPRILRDFPLLNDVWHAAQLDSARLVLFNALEPLPEIAFTIRGFTKLEIERQATDSFLPSLKRFPNLEEIRIADASRISKVGLESLAEHANLKRLSIHQVTLSLADFSCFESHSDLELALSIRQLSRDSETHSEDHRGIHALSKVKSLSLSITSRCDEELVRALCKIPHIRSISLRTSPGVTRSTLIQILESRDLRRADLTIEGVGTSISSRDVADVFSRMPRGSNLTLDYGDSPLSGEDLDALEQMSFRLGRSNADSNVQIVEDSSNLIGNSLSIRCIVDDDTLFERLCAIRKWFHASVIARGISAKGLECLRSHKHWTNWDVLFDQRSLHSPARLWAKMIPSELKSLIIIAPESIQTVEDATGLQSQLDTNYIFGDTTIWMGRDKNRMSSNHELHVVCHPPTVESLERLKTLPLNALLVVDLSDQDLTVDELMRIVTAIPRRYFEIDLRLPRSIRFTEHDTRPLKALAGVETLHLEVDLDDSAMFALADLPGLSNLDLRESDLSPNGLRWLEKCRGLRSIRFQPRRELRKSLRSASKMSSQLRRITIVRPSDNVVFAESLRELDKSLTDKDSKCQIEIESLSYQSGIEQLKQEIPRIRLTIQDDELDSLWALVNERIPSYKPRED